MKNVKLSRVFYVLTLTLAFMVDVSIAQTIQHAIKSCQCNHHNNLCSQKSKPQPYTKSKNANSLGYIRANTNPVLPSMYNFQEYVFAEPDDQGTCLGNQNATAEIEEIFLSQTHRHAIGHPLLFTIGERPALLQVAVTGSGIAPDVQVEGMIEGVTIGSLCLKGPAELSRSIELDRPNLADYFSVTLPKDWIKMGLELIITAGDNVRTLTQADLQITPYTEINLLLADIDVMDYNFYEEHRTPMFDGFLQELASAMPVSAIRLGTFPEHLRIPNLALNNNDGSAVVVEANDMLVDNGLDQGYINATALGILSSIQQATGDFPNTIYFGNTLNLAPGGWGGDGSLVSYDFTDIFIHEMGHALSLPHWEDEYQLANPNPDQFSYPYGGEAGDGGGRGDAWSFIQDTYEFVNPFCQDDNGNRGIERSDAMQREFPCVETRTSGQGPWDGFGDFSAKAISNYILGSAVEIGVVEYRGNQVDYVFKENPGYPRVSLENGQRIFTREDSQPQNTYAEDYIKVPGEEKIEQDVYLIYGSAHATDMEANIIYEPIKYQGTLPPVIDPTDPDMFFTLKNLEYEDAPRLYGESRDITLKLMYSDGNEEYALVPFHSYERPDTGEPDEKLDVAYFALVIPASQSLCGVELYRREFIITDSENDIPGNINDPAQNITATNFMDEARLMATLDYSCNCPGTPDYVEPGTPCDDGNPFTVDDVEDGFCNCVGVPVPPCGQIRNGEFTESLTGWRTWGSDASIINGEAAFENVDFGDAGLAIDGIELLPDEIYSIDFSAYSSEPKDIEVVVFDEDEMEFFRETVRLSTTKNNYQLSFTYEGTSASEAVLEFNFGSDESSVYLDDVCFDVDCSDIEEPYNGVDDDCDPSTPDDDLDQDGFGLAEDCDDNDPEINPGQMEIPYNGVNDDCNPFTLDDDLDQDGYDHSYDCDDNDPNVYPNQTEVVYNGIDDDCDPLTLDDDLDEDGFNLIDDCDDNDADINPNAAEACDGIDNNCNGGIDEGLTVTIYFLDNDGDGYGDPDQERSDCQQPNGFVLNADDCDDSNPNINPEAMEDAYNGVDDDCNPLTRDDDLDEDGFNLVDDCDDNDADINPDEVETCDGIDNNCNGDIDEGLTFVSYYADRDNDGYGNPDAQRSDCQHPNGFVLNADDCDDDNANINPDAIEEAYNGIDDDCNPATLDDDLDGDGFDLADDCDDTNADINPDAEEIPNNGIDENCDGQDLITAIHELNGQQIKVFPNPTSGNLFIKTETPFNFIAIIYDMNGREVLADDGNNAFDISSLPDGLYYLVIQDVNSDQRIVERISKVE